MPRVGLLVALLAGLARADAPPADDAKEAHAAFVAGQKAYKQGKYADAVAQFETAFRLKPHPTIRFNLAKCFEQQGEVAKALKAYRTYLLELPDTPDRDAVDKAITALERKLAKKGVQQLMVVAEPVDVSISVDGAALGGSPAFVELPAGNHRVLVEKPGLEAVARAFVMSTQRSLELSFVLQPPAPPPTPGLTGATVEEPPPPPPLVLDAAAGPALRGRAWIPLAGAGVGVLVAAIGFWQTGVNARALRDELDTQRAVTTHAQALASAGQTAQALAWVGVAVGLAGLATAFVFYLFPEGAAGPTFSLTAGGATFGLTGALP